MCNVYHPYIWGGADQGNQARIKPKYSESPFEGEYIYPCLCLAYFSPKFKSHTIWYQRFSRSCANLPPLPSPATIKPSATSCCRSLRPIHTRPSTIPSTLLLPTSSPSRLTARGYQLQGRCPQQILTRSLEAFCTEI
jgi:hypothetical protein